MSDDYKSDYDALRQFARLRDRSGNIKDSRPLVSFFYELMRGHMVPGTVEQILNNVLAERGDEVLFTNGYLASYAQYIVDELTSRSEPMTAQPLSAKALANRAVSRQDPREDLECRWCDEVKPTTLNGIYSQADPEGDVSRLCDSCLASCAG